jgi:hypothetical protein
MHGDKNQQKEMYNARAVESREWRAESLDKTREDKTTGNNYRRRKEREG